MVRDDFEFTPEFPVLVIDSLPAQFPLPKPEPRHSDYADRRNRYPFFIHPINLKPKSNSSIPSQRPARALFDAAVAKSQTMTMSPAASRRPLNSNATNPLSSFI